GVGSFGEWLRGHADKFDLVMVNEAHNQPLSRALVYQMLPIMRRLGFSILAMEALPDKATTDWINRHGYVPDEASYGYYLREPIDGEVIREAKRLGFTLANYDVFSDTREQDEARKLTNPQGASRPESLCRGRLRSYPPHGWPNGGIAAQV